MDISKRNNKPLISIIIVTFNASEYLKACLESIKMQSFRNFEVLISDGLSTDNTTDIIKEYQDDIAYWKSEADTGIYNAMNKTIKHAKGNWLYFLGADDVLMSGFSEMALKLQKLNTIYYGSCITTNETIFLGGKYSSYRLAKMNICHHAIFYPKDVFVQYEYEEKYIVSADHVLNMKCWWDNKFQWTFYPIIVAKYSLNGFSGKTLDLCFKNEREVLVKKYLGWYAYFRFKIKRFKERKKLFT